MGGAPYSYIEYQNGYGKFYGTASSDGGGFSKVGQIDYSNNGWQEFSDMNTIYDLSEYDGLVIEVAS